MQREGDPSLTEPAEPSQGQTFRIGTVSRLTGVPADTLRVWERRYHVVTPVRSDAGTRLYAAEDVGRLSLIKRLVDGGDTISSVANLSLESLQERMRGADRPERFSVARRACRVVVCGSYLAERLRAQPPAPVGIEVLGCFATGASLLSAGLAQVPDVLVLELPTLHRDQIREVGRLLSGTGAARALLIYGCAGRAVLAALDASRIKSLRAPVDIDELWHWCLELAPEVQAPRTSDEASGFGALGAPARRFTEADLARLGAASESECDLARHLVDLVSALSACERYALECADRSAEDRPQARAIASSTAHARSLMELALEQATSCDTVADLGND